MNILYSFHIIIYIILLYNNAVYSGDVEYESCISISVPKQNTINLSTNGPGGDLIELRLLFSSMYTTHLASKIHVYRIDQSNQDKLSYPNTITKLTFQGKIYSFADNVTLPTTKSDLISIYSCKHNIPYLICIYGELIHYYFKWDENTKTWTNYTLINDTRFNEFKDTNGSSYYSNSINYDPSSPDENIDEPLALVSQYCNDTNCMQSDITSEDNL